MLDVRHVSPMLLIRQDPISIDFHVFYVRNSYVFCIFRGLNKNIIHRLKIRISFDVFSIIYLFNIL